MKTNRDVQLTYCGQTIIIPKGAEVVNVAGQGGGYAVASKKLLEELTGNTHDPTYRYAWLPDGAVDTTP